MIILINGCITINKTQIDYCQILNKLFENEEFCEVYSFNVCKSDTLKFIDNNSIFQNCNNKKINGYTILIKVKNDFIPSGYLTLEESRNYLNVISIDSIKSIGDTLILNISRKVTNHTGEFKFIKIGNSYNLVNYRIGQY